MSVARILVILLATAGLQAQTVQPPPAPWRGAGPTPCVGSDGGVIQCAPATATVAIRAGRLFDSRTGQLRARQVIVVEGERITDVGPEAEVRIPTGAQVIDLSRATVLPGLIDAHTHMFNTPKARHDAGAVDADRRAQPAGRPAGRLHVGARHELARQRLRRRRHPQRDQRGTPRRAAISGSGRGIVWAGSRQRRTGQSAREHRGPVGGRGARRRPRPRASIGVDWIKLFPTGAYSFTPTGEAQYALTYPMPVLQALIDETHRLGHKAACHVLGGEGQKNAITAGCDTIEHAFGLTQEQANADGAEGSLLRSDVRPLSRAVHGRQRHQEHRRQVPDDSDLREGGDDGGGDQGDEDHGRQRRRRFDLRARHAGARFRSARQTRAA